MIKKLFIFVLLAATLGTFAQAQYRHRGGPAYPRPVPRPYPYPSPYPAPYPYYPAPIIIQPNILTCYAQGLGNGVIYFGTGFDIYTANQRALIICQSYGQYCQLTGCR